MIHTDFEKGFIRAETIAYADYVALGGEAGARDAGKLRLEGKEYVVAEFPGGASSAMVSHRVLGRALKGGADG